MKGRSNHNKMEWDELKCWLIFLLALFILAAPSLLIYL